MYWSGVFSGVTASAIAVLVWMGAQLGAFRAMYADFGGPLPMVSQVVLHPGFQWGAPAVLLAALLGINLHGRRHSILLGILAALAVAAAIVEYWGVHLPINQLAAPLR
ncbi:MAG TPA: hypothetical protein VML75_15155 [Kofleriaceae bacterium]|nr:hypothetical protein [Kofleriaceae bacterium]